MRLFVLMFLAGAPLLLFSQKSDIRQLYEQVNPAVVTIEVKEKEAVSSGNKTRVVTAGGIGSGVMVDAEGLILTAAHVVQTAEGIQVKFPDGEVVPAKVISSSVSADVALIKLVWKPKNQRVAPLGNSDEVKVGDRVMVIGSPYGLEHSLSVGYISRRHQGQNISTGLTLTEFFQTDAAINQGNSGGPLINMKGEVIGIVSYILSQSGGFQGLGFAATSNIAARMLEKTHQFWSGLETIYVSGALARVLNVPQGSGLLVQKVAALSPADIVGLEGGKYKIKFEGEELLVGGDILLSVNDIKITDEASLQKIQEKILSLQNGETISITYLRGGIVEKSSYILSD